MRDPGRIPELLALVQEVWEHVPDQRLTQLLLNACRELAGAGWPDVWNVEDDDLRRALERMLREAEQGHVWVLCRQDDDGHSFEVDRFALREQAEQARRELASRGHKQHYWVEERPEG